MDDPRVIEGMQRGELAGYPVGYEQFERWRDSLSSEECEELYQEYLEDYPIECGGAYFDDWLYTYWKGVDDDTSADD